MNDQPATKMPDYIPKDFWFPVDASTVAHFVDDDFYFIYWVCVFFFVLICVGLVAFTVMFRRRPGVEPQPSPHHNQWLEITWSAIPGLIVIVMFYRGMVGYIDLRTPPAEANQMRVLGKKWAWDFQYPKSGHIDNELHVVKDQPTTLTMTSDDVIHSVFIPAFRVKQDVVPGRYSQLWFTPTRVGEYTLFCTEYCGTRHSEMLAKVVVHDSAADYDKWFNVASDLFKTNPPVKVGEILYNKRGCVQCHSVDGSAKTGPTFKGTWGTKQKLTTGEEITVDANYVRQSILEPMSQIRAGYNPVMPSFKGQLSDRQIEAIAMYIESLK